MKNQNNTVSIVIPALNEEKNIELSIFSVLNSLKEFNIEGEIIVINDGSTDKTPLIIKNIMKSHNNVHIIEHRKPLGIGRSMWDGIKKAKMDIVTFSPGDNENNPSETLQYINLMNKVDIIIPFIHNLEVRSLFRRILSTIFRMIINFSFGINLNYTNGAVIYRRCILNDINLKSFGFFYQTDLLVSLIRRGYLFAEVPHFLSTRGGGKSKALTFRSLFVVLKDYLRLFFKVHIIKSEGTTTKSITKDSVTYSRKKS